ncbi:type II toxin-antitoxin system RelE/ParE family toxin [Mesorhizobium sp. 1B3]|uniref:type II toxin-antitoxin system RelE/ParE family toxin n=1 Tax=Mesorhizobium sp. 1B3 TaxID=3243599 RepID=UPI003D9940CE
MTVFVTKEFARFRRKARLSTEKLLDAASELADGRFDADLGGGVFKQRVARNGGGKSGGFRTIIVFRVGGHSFFVHGFAKNAKANVSTKELKALRQLAGLLLGFTTQQLATAISSGELIEVLSDGNEA